MIVKQAKKDSVRFYPLNKKSLNSNNNWIKTFASLHLVHFEFDFYDTVNIQPRSHSQLVANRSRSRFSVEHEGIQGQISNNNIWHLVRLSKHSLLTNSSHIMTCYAFWTCILGGHCLVRFRHQNCKTTYFNLNITTFNVCHCFWIS